MVYDITDDKRRLKVAKFLESLGDRAQKSVFEIYLTPQELQRMLVRLKKLILEKEDAVRVYDLCGSCREKVKSLGQGEIARPPEATFV